VLMSTSSYRFSTEFAAPPARDAVDGLAAIASAVDQGLVAPTTSPRCPQFADMCAIALGWAVLVAVVLHPELQLAAIGLCVGMIALRSIWRLVLGPRERSYPRALPAGGPLVRYS